jgi:hypothetical protein
MSPEVALTLVCGLVCINPIAMFVLGYWLRSKRRFRSPLAPLDEEPLGGYARAPKRVIERNA